MLGQHVSNKLDFENKAIDIQNIFDYLCITLHFTALFSLHTKLFSMPIFFPN